MNKDTGEFEPDINNSYYIVLHSFLAEAYIASQQYPAYTGEIIAFIRNYIENEMFRKESSKGKQKAVAYLSDELDFKYNEDTDYKERLDELRNRINSAIYELNSIGLYKEAIVFEAFETKLMHMIYMEEKRHEE